MAKAITRTQFLRGDFSGQRLPIRPPWALNEAEFIVQCSRCDACIQVCPEHILTKGQGGFPQIDFSRGECTFCEQCLNCCENDALSLTINPPWSLKAVVAESCLASQGVTCMSCAEQCELEAIRFQHRMANAPLPEIDSTICTGCGACFKSCPARAINLVYTNLTYSNPQLKRTEAQ